MPISVPVSLLTCVCVCYNGALALWHLRYIINLKAWIISCRCTPGNQGGDDGVVDGGRGVGGTAGVFVWVCAGGSGGEVGSPAVVGWRTTLANIWRQLGSYTSCTSHAYWTFFFKLLPGNWLQSAQEREASVSSIHPSSSVPLSIIIDVNYRDD